MTLRHITSWRVAARRFPVEYLDVPTKRLLQSKNQPKSSRLPCPVGADNRDKLARVNGETGLSPDRVVWVTSCQVSSSDDFRGYRFQPSMSKGFASSAR